MRKIQIVRINQSEAWIEEAEVTLPIGIDYRDKNWLWRAASSSISTEGDSKFWKLFTTMEVEFNDNGDWVVWQSVENYNKAEPFYIDGFRYN